MVCPICQGAGTVQTEDTDAACSHCRGRGVVPGSFDLDLTNDRTGITSRWHLTVSPAETRRVGLAIPADVILDECAWFFGITVADLCGPSRRQQLNRARQATFYALRELTDLSYPTIAQRFGRDHTSVMQAMETVRSIQEHRPNDLAITVGQLMEHLRGVTFTNPTPDRPDDHDA